MKNFRENRLITAVLINFILVGGYIAVVNVRESGKVASAVTSEKEQNGKIKASILISFGEDKRILSSQSVQNVEIPEGQTALDLTKKVATVEATGEGEMAFVTAINGRAANKSKREFWEFIVNGEPAEVGAGSYKVRSGDKIEWRLSIY